MKAIAVREGPVTSIDEAIDRYPGQWLLMAVKSYANGWPNAGVLLAHARDQEGAWQAWSAFDNSGHEKLCIFEAVPVIKTGEEARAALRELVESGVIPEPIGWPR